MLLYMTTIVPKRAESISDVVTPQRFDRVELRFELPSNVNDRERKLYQMLSSMSGVSRAGGGTYQTLDICIDRGSYRKILEELEGNPRLVKSAIFTEGRDWPWKVVDAYLLQGAEKIKTELL